MFRRYFLQATVSILLGVSAVASSADTIELRADYWCPYNCDPDSELPGFMVEIAREALGMFGHEVNYELLTWARSLEYAHNGRVHGVIGTNSLETPDLVQGPEMGPYVEAAAFRIGDAVNIWENGSLEGLRLGGIYGYEYSALVDEYVLQNKRNRAFVQLLSGDNALKNNLKKLLAGRVDIVPEDRAVLAYTLKKLKLENSFEIIEAEPEEALHIAFSPKLETSTTYAAQLKEGMERLRETGRLEEIMAKYGLPVF